MWGGIVGRSSCWINHTWLFGLLYQLPEPSRWEADSPLLLQANLLQHAVDTLLSLIPCDAVHGEAHL